MAGTAARHAAFVEAYLTNGHNATAAATAIGCAGRQLANGAWKLLHHPNVQRLLAARARQVAELAQMNTENWAAWLCAVAFSDIGELFDADGKPIPVERLPPHVRAAISSVKVRTTAENETVMEYRFWDKVGALTVSSTARSACNRRLSRRCCASADCRHRTSGLCWQPPWSFGCSPARLSHMRLPVYRRILVAAALLEGSHALHDSFSVIRWRGAGIDFFTVSVLWSESVFAEVVVFLLIGPRAIP